MTAASGTVARPLRISHVWLYCKDTAKSIRFYRDVVGLSVVETFPDGALFQGGAVLLGIHREEGDGKSDPGGSFIVVETDNIKELFEELQRKGVTFLKPSIQKAGYGQTADFRDPDGYLLEIWQPPEKK